MDSAVAANMQGSRGRRASVPSASVHQMPLSFLHGGESALIAKVRGKNDLHHHLESLGFVEGAQVRVVSVVAGDLIVEIKGTQVALNRQVAAHIITTAAA